MSRRIDGRWMKRKFSLKSLPAGAIVFVLFFASCTKSHDDGGSASTAKAGPKSGSESVMQKKAKDGFVPYANRPPFGTPVETH